MKVLGFCALLLLVTLGALLNNPITSAAPLQISGSVSLGQLMELVVLVIAATSLYIKLRNRQDKANNLTKQTNDLLRESLDTLKDSQNRLMQWHSDHEKQSQRRDESIDELKKDMGEAQVLLSNHEARIGGLERTH